MVLDRRLRLITLTAMRLVRYRKTSHAIHFTSRDVAHQADDSIVHVKN